MRRATLLTGILAGALLWMPALTKAQTPGGTDNGLPQSASNARQTTPKQKAAKQAAKDESTVEDLQPFTHIALIPADADLGSIRFQGAKAVQIATRIRSSFDSRRCDELANRAPVRSQYCPEVGLEGFTPAYQVTYSFEGQPLASDEYGNRNYTFSVYFQPAEIDPAEREAILGREGSKSSGAESFKVTSTRQLRPQTVIDDAHSTFCEGTYIDGEWVRMNPRCEDVVKVKTVMAPSGYVAMKVEPVPGNAGPVTERSPAESLAP